MKRTCQYIALAALALGFAACSQEDDFAPQQEDIVKIASANIATEVQTRVNTLGDGKAWENADQILLVNNNRDNKNSGTYTATVTGGTTTWALAEGLVLYASSGTNDFTAYYPASVDFTLPTDQSDEAKIKSADRMVATTTGVAKSTAVALSFERQNAMVTITPTITSEFGIGASIGELTIADITPYHPEDATDYKAIIAPATGFTVSLTVGEQTLTATSSTQIEAGKHYTFNLKVGKDAVSISSVSVTPWSEKTIDGGVAEEVDYIYNESTNTYTVRTADALNTAISNAGTSGTTEKPAKIMLMNDIAVEAKEDEYGSIDYAVLIETGNIIIDLNGCQLSATNDPYGIIQIGAEWGELYDAVVTIDDSSMDKSGKIVGLLVGIRNNGGTLIFNNGTIEVNCTEVASAAIGIESYKGSVTVNGGTINVTGVAEYSVTAGIYEDGDGGTVTVNGGSINVNSPLSYAFYARSNWFIKGGTITSNGYHIEYDGTVSLQTNDEGIGATFVGGIKSSNTLNSLLSEGVGYYGADGNLIEVADDVKEITDKGDITVKKVAATE